MPAGGIRRCRPLRGRDVDRYMCCQLIYSIHKHHVPSRVDSIGGS